MKYLLYVVICIFILGCDLEYINYLTPIMKTEEAKSVLGNSATLGGKAMGEGGKIITEYGIVWSTIFPPTINDNKSIEGNRLGYFSSQFTGFLSNTTYYYCAYGMNEEGVGYGSVYEFTTTPEAPCNPIEDDYIDFGQEQEFLNGIIKRDPISGTEGNVQFVGNSNGYPEVMISFYELNNELPKSGEYIAVERFDNESIKSNGEIILDISDYSFNGLGGGIAAPGEKIYVINEGNEVTFVFCDTPVAENYVINGKFTYK